MDFIKEFEKVQSDKKLRFVPPPEGSFVHKPFYHRKYNTNEMETMQTKCGKQVNPIEQKEKSLEEIVLEKGFESMQEFFSLVSQVDFSETLLSAFNQWQDNDGSKSGLMKLLKLE